VNDQRLLYGFVTDGYQVSVTFGQQTVAVSYADTATEGLRMFAARLPESSVAGPDEGTIDIIDQQGRPAGAMPFT
jgi:hypothetical protein